MKLNAPKQVVFIICVCLIILGLLGYLVPGIPDIVNANSYWITFAGGTLLAFACLLKGM
jgi:quinol-cytochrome oxidoreductase complex cytochrome b subunit